MARRPTAPPPDTQPAILSHEQIQLGITKLGRRLNEVNALVIDQVERGSDPAIERIELALKTTLAEVFGPNTLEYGHLWPATNLDLTAYRMSVNGRGGTTRQEIREGVRRGQQRTMALLEGAISSLQERLEDMPAIATSPTSAPQAESRVAPSRRAFVVHGHDGEARESVARFLAQIEVEPIILHEQANQGRTVIEKVEANSNVGFAVILLTPDDQGGLNGGPLQSRARQNVILELGYFVGLLGRNKVCALKRGDLELPSDFGGVVYESFDPAGAWKQRLARELEAAGISIDWNNVMRGR